VMAIKFHMWKFFAAGLTQKHSILMYPGIAMGLKTVLFLEVRGTVLAHISIP